jgi:hypothetical protein
MISTNFNMKQPKITSRRVFRDRRATTMLEVLVSFTLLISVLGVSAPLIVRQGRLMSGQRQYRMALDEATNQLERLSSLSETQCRKELDSLKPSELIAQRLPRVKLHGKLEAADIGQRLTLQLTWGDRPHAGTSITMAAWILPQENGR